VRGQPELRRDPAHRSVRRLDEDHLLAVDPLESVVGNEQHVRLLGYDDLHLGRHLRPQQGRLLGTDADQRLIVDDIVADFRLRVDGQHLAFENAPRESVDLEFHLLSRLHLADVGFVHVDPHLQTLRIGGR
jgi:hypothetical protein